jgi:ribosomal protein L11 methyltransferase
MSSWSLTLEPSPADRELLIADLWEAGTTGITEEDSQVRAFFEGSADRERLLRQFAAFQPQIEEYEERDWVQHARSMWRPCAVGERFWLTPEWIEDTAPQGRLRLLMRPGMAAGSGAHPATQLCLIALEKTVEPHMAVFDVGTGSGILADAARLLGAGRVAGCDIDHEATRIAHRNVPDAVFYTGSLRSLRPRIFDVAVGNLNAAAIATLASDLGTAAPAVVVSGFKEEEALHVEKLLRRPVKQTLELDGWACLIC